MQFTYDDEVYTNWGRIEQLSFNPERRILKGILKEIPIVLHLKKDGSLTSSFCPIRGTGEKWTMSPVRKIAMERPKNPEESSPVFAFKQYALDNEKYGAIIFTSPKEGRQTRDAT